MTGKEISRFIDVRSIVGEKYPIFAHKGNGKKELLEEHIERCLYYYDVLEKEKGLGDIIQKFVTLSDFEHKEVIFDYIQFLFKQVVVFHDMGKINPQFQLENMDNPLPQVTYEGISGKDHSLLSSIIFIDYFWNDIVCFSKENGISKPDQTQLKRLVLDFSYIIARHHSDLNSFNCFRELLNSGEIEKLLDALPLRPLLDYSGLKILNFNMLNKFADKYRNKRMNMTREEDTRLFFLCRLLYSVLVTCDYYATNEYFSGSQKTYYGTFKDISAFQEMYTNSELSKSIRNYEKAIHSSNSNIANIHDMNALRNELFLEAEKGFQKNPNESVYFLEAPTGSGKSNVALNISLKMLHDMNGRKMFYIYPFNTLVEQNWQTLRKSFSNENLFEQVAVVNSLTPMKGMEEKDESSEMYYQKALLDRQFLNYPFILSTHVSFFNLLFGNDKQNLFGFLQLSKAVVVLDEIQSYRNTIWAEIIIFLKTCAELMGMKIIIMSATLPRLEVLGGDNCKVSYLLEDSSKYFLHPIFKNRVEISYKILDEKMTFDRLSDHILSVVNTEKKILVEFIKKESALNFYQRMCVNNEITIPVRCITGDDSLHDREKVLKPIQENAEKSVLLIATQVIEAGVDIDMDIGYKDISKLDSEEQFMGRINRSCKKNGIVYFFNMDQAESIYHDDYRMTKSLSLEEKEMQNILKEKSFLEYYNRVLNQLKEKRNKSTDEKGIDYFFENSVKLLDFPSIAKRMQLIDENQWTMDIVLCRQIELEDGTTLNGEDVWEEYKSLLQDNQIEYAEKIVKLSIIKSQLSNFVYQVKKNVGIAYDDYIGNLICKKNGDQYFFNGKLDKKRLETEGVLFI